MKNGISPLCNVFILSLDSKECSFIPIPSDLVRDDELLDAILRKISKSFLGYMETHLPIVKITLADAARFPEGARQIYQESVLKDNLIMADFLEKPC